ncbi:hypothetical protein CRG98_023663 [Punica granatum]|uniref:Uncharacterized protein n=1 Tax=Punica granatum TaxID=22663 RepID=A0A2I0JI51_PUNGR|nr:hypothetical protein CRG98_023663 [Punica granatum]
MTSYRMEPGSSKPSPCADNRAKHHKFEPSHDRSRVVRGGPRHPRSSVTKATTPLFQPCPPSSPQALPLASRVCNDPIEYRHSSPVRPNSPLRPNILVRPSSPGHSLFSRVCHDSIGYPNRPDSSSISLFFRTAPYLPNSVNIPT